MYQAAFYFVDDQCDQQGHPLDLRFLASDMSFNKDYKFTSDPASWHCWLEAVYFVKHKKRIHLGQDCAVLDNANKTTTTCLLNEIEAFNALYLFIEQYASETSKPPKLMDLLGKMVIANDDYINDKEADNVLWADWIKAIMKSVKPENESDRDHNIIPRVNSTKYVPIAGVKKRVI